MNARAANGTNPMHEEIKRILKLVEEGKLTGEQASAMIDALEQAERRAARGPERGARASKDDRRRHGNRRRRERVFGGVLDDLGAYIGHAVDEAMRGVGKGSILRGVFVTAGVDEDWVDDTNSATLAKVEEPSGEDFKAEGNRMVVSELARLHLRQAEFCDNEMHAAALRDVEVADGPLSRNALRGSSLKRASFTASKVTGNQLNGASLSHLTVTSSVFKDNVLNGAQIRELDMQSAEIRSTTLAGAKLRNITLVDGASLTDVKISGVVGEHWKLAASHWSGVRIAAARVSGLTANAANLTDCAITTGTGHRRTWTRGRDRVGVPADLAAEEFTRVRDLTLDTVNLKGCEFIDCTFDGTTIKDVDAEGLRFVGVDFTGLTIDSVARFKALASVSDAA